jgi:hypothetical protein
MFRDLRPRGLNSSFVGIGAACKNLSRLQGHENVHQQEARIMIQTESAIILDHRYDMVVSIKCRTKADLPFCRRYLYVQAPL